MISVVVSSFGRNRAASSKTILSEKANTQWILLGLVKQFFAEINSFFMWFKQSYTKSGNFRVKIVKGHKKDRKRARDGKRPRKMGSPVLYYKERLLVRSHIFVRPHEFSPKQKERWTEKVLQNKWPHFSILSSLISLVGTEIHEVDSQCTICPGIQN